MPVKHGAAWRSVALQWIAGHQALESSDVQHILRVALGPATAGQVFLAPNTALQMCMSYVPSCLIV